MRAAFAFARRTAADLTPPRLAAAMRRRHGVKVQVAGRAVFGSRSTTAKRVSGWTVDATAERYDHAERIEEARAALVKSGGAGVKATQF